MRLKNIIIPFLFFIIEGKIQSQIVFCSIGAEWHYSFSPGENNTPVENEKIMYVRDSIDGGDIVKVLQHERFYKVWNLTPSKGCILTLIKQRGDTIFMKNPGTQDKWQILYNFSAVAGQSWQDSICEVDPAITFGPTVAFSYTVIVDSVRTVLINNFQLKTLYVRYVTSGGLPYMKIDTVQITERLGCSRFMFNYYPLFHESSEIQTTEIRDFLCYEDDSFGLNKFTSYPCDYSYYLGIEKETEPINCIKIYPNPSNDKIFFDIPFQDNIEITVFSTLGSEVLKIKDYPNLSALNVSGLKDGVYLYKVRTKTNNYSGKFVKE